MTTSSWTQKCFEPTWTPFSGRVEKCLLYYYIGTDLINDFWRIAQHRPAGFFLSFPADSQILAVPKTRSTECEKLHRVHSHGQFNCPANCPCHQITRRTDAVVTITSSYYFAWRDWAVEDKLPWFESVSVVACRAWIGLFDIHRCFSTGLKLDMHSGLARPVSFEIPWVDKNHHGGLGWLFCDHSKLWICRSGRLWTQYSLPMNWNQMELSCTRHWIMGCHLDSGRIFQECFHFSDDGQSTRWIISQESPELSLKWL